ncbi:MAG: DNA polymerase III subunit gamma/tau [Alphaproteobacteria bacterium]|nr:DNA polymerase III subunit gamma/tau [Alphaproteobacteria bacterium]
MYIPLATKYRPQKFSDVVGQDIVVKILSKAVQKDRVGHAILFSGTRGVGKTTLARILAKSLRCEKRQSSESDPCCKCQSCQNFSKDSQIDVIEIDAASNTGVDDVREIIESCRYRPSSGMYKIFIIDEVHMLSKSAFNALLKTLEEPPPHVKFLLATTETYKVPETILSRVMRLDLKNVDENVIAQYLSSICNQEGIVAGADVLNLIARAANGSIRDSISILDQAINMLDNNMLILSDIQEMLGFTDDKVMVGLFASVLSGNLKESIIQYRKIIASGGSPEVIVSRLMDYVHLASCMKSQIELLPDVVLSDCESEFRRIVEKTSLAVLTRIWQMLVKGSYELKFTDRPELVVEMLLMRISYSSDIPDLYQIIKKLESENFENGNQHDIIPRQGKSSLIESAMNMFPNATVQK